MNKSRETVKKSSFLHRFQNSEEIFNFLHCFFPSTNQRPIYESFPVIRTIV
jgi:hypothetical protein